MMPVIALKFVGIPNHCLPRKTERIYTYESWQVSFLSWYLNFTLSAQLPVTVAELTVEVNLQQRREFLLRLRGGDLLIARLELPDGKSLKVFEVIEYPENSRILEYETEGFEDKRLKVYDRGIFQFRLYNTHRLKKRVCRLRIQRLLSSAPPPTSTRQCVGRSGWIRSTRCGRKPCCPVRR
ncbi:MAG: hypothetical protein H6559_10390 [Lewinellaceae bacterium]|nr:hypothetical protein [Lewinellaceae bacterium]